MSTVAATESEFAPLVRSEYPQATYHIDDDTGQYFIADEAAEVALSVPFAAVAEAWEDAWERIQADIDEIRDETTESNDDPAAIAIDTQDGREVVTTVETAPNVNLCDLEEGSDELHDAEIEQTENVATTTEVVIEASEAGETVSVELSSLVSMETASTATVETERAPTVDGLLNRIAEHDAEYSPVLTRHERCHTVMFTDSPVATSAAPPAPIQPAANRRELLTRIGYQRDEVAAKAVEISRAAKVLKDLKSELKVITGELSDDEAEYEQLYGHPAERDELGDDYEMEFDVPADVVTSAASKNETPSLVSVSSAPPVPTTSSVGHIDALTPQPPAAATPATDEAGNADLWALYEYGLTKSQAEKLRDDLSIRTIRDLESFMRAGNLTPAKMKQAGVKGFGEAACAKISDAWGAYRRVHPVLEVCDASEDPDDRHGPDDFDHVPGRTADEIAYGDGADAAADHLEISANPHRRGTAESIAWDRGYAEWDGE